MDLNLFLEKDIIEFLEKEENKRRNRMEEVEDEEFDFFNIQKDYYKRLIRALDQNDVEKAKEIFDDVKKKHEEAKNELEKKQLYTLLDDIYMEIKKHTDKTKNDAELEQEVESIEKDGVITKESDKQEQKKEQEKIKNEIAESSVKINSYLRKEDLQAAMIEYKTMKSKFNKLDGTEEEKEDVFQDVMAAYYQIKRLEKHVQEKKLTREQKKKIDKEETAKKVKKEISEKTKEIIGHLKDNQISEAKNKHEELRQKISQIPVEYEDDIAEYKTHADTIDNQIKELELLQQKIQEAKNDQKAKVEPKLVIEKIGTEQTIDKKSTEERELKKEKEETKPEPDNEIKEELLKEKIEEIKEEVRNHTQKITELLREEKLKESINEYQIQKAIFDSFEGPHEEKEEMFHDVIASFENIKKFEEHLKEKKKTRIEKKKQEQKEEIEKIKTRAKTITKRIIYNLKKQNLTRAMDEYNNLKHQFQSIPAEFKEERKTLFEHTMKIYMHIKEIEDIIINLQRKKTELKKINNIETSDENIKKMYELKTELRDIIELIKEKKFKEASIEIMDTKHELEKIPQTYEKEVGQFQNLISQMVQKINFLKQINEKRPGETKENA